MQRPSTVVTAGALLVAAGVAFLATSVYLFAVLTAAGFEIEMFDDPVSLMPWVAAHSRLYQGLWVLYFLTQAALLLVPSLLGEHLNHRATAVLGTTAVLLANLPKLPEDLEYRIIGHTLILRDVHANIIVDYLPKAIQ